MEQFMAFCDECGNYDQSHIDGVAEHDKRIYHNESTDFQPDLYYYWAVSDTHLRAHETV